MPVNIERASELMKLFGSPTRLRLLQVLYTQGEKCVTDLCKALGAEQSLISHDLIKMTDKGVLTCRREGKRKYYSITDKAALKIASAIF